MADKQDDKMTGETKGFLEKMKPYHEPIRSAYYVWFMGMSVLVVVGAAWQRYLLPNAPIVLAFGFGIVLIVATWAHAINTTAERLLWRRKFSAFLTVIPALFALMTGIAVVVAIEHAGELQPLWYVNIVVGFTCLGLSLLAVVTAYANKLMTLGMDILALGAADIPNVLKHHGVSGRLKETSARRFKGDQLD